MSGSIVWRIEAGLYLIDHQFQGLAGVIGSFLISGDGPLTLIETGPTTTIDTLLEGIRSAGFDPSEIEQIAVTHIHLDHAGAAGTLMEKIPNATLLVHPAGAPHMVDPTRLLRSATRIYGDDMERLWGEVVPVPESRIRPLDDGDSFKAGDRSLTAYSTPGHASHHHAFLDTNHGNLFAGDAAGVRLSNVPYVRPPTVPPEFDLETWRQTISRMRILEPTKIHPTHFGTFDDPEWHLDDLMCRLYFWSGWASGRLRQETDTTILKEELQSFGDAEIIDTTGSSDLVHPYEVAMSYQMTIDGIARYFRKRWES